MGRRAARCDNHRIGDRRFAVEVNGENIFSLRIIEAVQDVPYEVTGIGFSLNTNRLEQSFACSGLDRGCQSLFLLCAARRAAHR
jgi:hypothetical protein